MGNNANQLKREIDQFSLDGKLIRTFESMSKAVEETKVSCASICMACRGKRSQAGGFIWKYNNTNQKIKKDPLDEILFNDDLSDDDEW